MSDSLHPRAKINTHPDRAITDDAWITAFLNRAGMATIATAQGEQPFLSTLLFACDEPAHAIYFHTARRGRVWENLYASESANPRVCLTAAEMGRLLPADTALNFSVEYQSVVVFGSAHLVEDPAEAERALQRILDKYFPHLHPGRDYRAITPEELRATAVYRLDIEEWSAKRKSVGEDFPGSFLWGEK
jgi:nitroimidazol reductase NimA-like FMN-containing flavoprotein (pyridoxamine 5'-phosphate oxidase superfamily)